MWNTSLHNMCIYVCTQRDAKLVHAIAVNICHPLKVHVLLPLFSWVSEMSFCMIHTTKVPLSKYFKKDVNFHCSYDLSQYILGVSGYKFDFGCRNPTELKQLVQLLNEFLTKNRLWTCLITKHLMLWNQNLTSISKPSERGLLWH